MRASIVIPTFNAGPDISILLDRLRAQKPNIPQEIIAIDSGSTDDTRERVRAAGGRVIEWHQPFNHGLTRDAGIAASSGDIVFLTVQDALPASDDWLARVAAHFEDESVAGVTTRQVPPAGGPLELQIKARLDAAACSDPQRISLAAHPDYSRYSAEQRLELYRFDNVCSAVRRSVWEKIQFGRCRYAEDFLWAKHVLEAGHVLIRDPSAAASVVHAHRRSFVYEFRRALLDAWVLDEVFDFRYSFIKKLNRFKALAARTSGEAGQNGAPARMGALKTYTAHVLARGAYGAYRTMMKPLGIGQGALGVITDGI